MRRTLAGLMIACAACAALADDASDDQALLRQAARARTAEQTPPATAPTAPAEDLDAAEQAARSAANLAVARLELVQARKALAGNKFEDAARQALHVQVLLRQLPPDVDADDIALQADGILMRAQRQGVNVEALRRDATATAPLPPDQREQDRQAQAAARIARNYDGSARPDIDARGNAQVLRDRALRRQIQDVHAFRPGREIIDVDALQAGAQQEQYYQDALREAYKRDEVRVLTNADEARVVPDGDVSYPADWPERVARRQQYESGMIARGPSWTDDQGREWYAAIYDVRDLIYVPPDFGHSGQFMMDPFAYRNSQIRRAILDQPWMWGSYGGACDGGYNCGYDARSGLIPLMRYFGGVNPWIDRGPKYSLERQQQIVDMIQAFTLAGQQGQIIIVPPTQ